MSWNASLLGLWLAFVHTGNASAQHVASEVVARIHAGDGLSDVQWIPMTPQESSIGGVALPALYPIPLGDDWPRWATAAQLATAARAALSDAYVVTLPKQEGAIFERIRTFVEVLPRNRADDFVLGNNAPGEKHVEANLTAFMRVAKAAAPLCQVAGVNWSVPFVSRGWAEGQFPIMSISAQGTSDTLDEVYLYVQQYRAGPWQMGCQVSRRVALWKLLHAAVQKTWGVASYTGRVAIPPSMAAFVTRSLVVEETTTEWTETETAQESTSSCGRDLPVCALLPEIAVPDNKLKTHRLQLPSFIPNDDALIDPYVSSVATACCQGITTRRISNRSQRTRERPATVADVRALLTSYAQECPRAFRLVGEFSLLSSDSSQVVVRSERLDKRMVKTVHRQTRRRLQHAVFDLVTGEPVPGRYNKQACATSAAQ